MIKAIPAIDIIEGKCVRLTQGSFEQKKSNVDTPLEVALRIADFGFTKLHLVDLDGERAGRVVSYKILERIAVSTPLSIDFTGGLCTSKDLEIAFECGAKQVTIGSEAMTDPDHVREWFKAYSAEQLILGADVLDGRIATEDGQQITETAIEEFVADWSATSKMRTVICTDITRDDKLQGPNVELYRELIDRFSDLEWIASGGVLSLADVEQLSRVGLWGVVIGKAMFDGRINLAELKTISS